MPCIIRWPGQVPAGTTCAEVSATVDLLPTLTRLAGGQPPTDRPLDGKDIRPLLFGEAGAKSPHEHYVLAHGPGAVRSGQVRPLLLSPQHGQLSPEREILGDRARPRSEGGPKRADGRHDQVDHGGTLAQLA